MADGFRASMSEVLWIQGGRVIDPANGRDGVGDVFAVDGRIVAALTPQQQARASVVDATGLVVAPGFVELNAHLREPGDTHKETIATGTRAAAAGGFTTVVSSSNTKPPADNPGTIQLIADAIARSAKVRVYQTGCLSMGRKGEMLAPIGSLKRRGTEDPAQWPQPGDVVAVGDGGHCIQSNELMRRAVEYARMFGLVVYERPEDASLTEGCHMNEGEWSLRLGLRGMHRAAEDLMVARAVIFSEHFDARIHLQGISSEWSAEAIRRARKRGIQVTADLTPHHIALTEEALRDYSTDLKSVPPLRTEADRKRLIKGLVEGSIDAISTAHAPHTPMEKDKEFDYAPPGLCGLETALPVCLEALVKAGHCDLPTLIDCLTRRPASVLGLPHGTLSTGAHADIVCLDPAAQWTVNAETLYSRSHNTPWLGHVVEGRVCRTYVGGQLVHGPNPNA